MKPSYVLRYPHAPSATRVARVNQVHTHNVRRKMEWKEGMPIGRLNQTRRMPRETLPCISVSWLDLFVPTCRYHLGLLLLLPRCFVWFSNVYSCVGVTCGDKDVSS